MDSDSQAASLLSKSSPTENNDIGKTSSASNGSIIHTNGGSSHCDDDVEEGYVSGKEEFEESELKNPIEDALENKALEKGSVGVDASETFVDSLSVPILNVSTPVIVEAGDNDDDDDVQKGSQTAPAVIESQETEIFFVPEEGKVVSEESVQNGSFEGNDIDDLSPVDVSNESGIGDNPSSDVPDLAQTSTSVALQPISDGNLGSMDNQEQLLEEPEVALANELFSGSDTIPHAKIENTVEEDSFKLEPDSARETVKVAEVGPERETQVNEDTELEVEPPSIWSHIPSNGHEQASDEIEKFLEELVETCSEAGPEDNLKLKPNGSSATETVNVSEAATTGATELEVEAVMFSSVPSNEHEQDSHEIEKFLEELVETDSIARESASDLVAIDDFGKFQPGGGENEDMGSIQKLEQFSYRVEDVPTEVVLDRGTDSENVVLDFAATEGERANVSTEEGSSLESAEAVVQAPQEEVSAAEEVLAQRSTSELVAHEGTFDDNITTSTMTADYGSEKDIVGDTESQPSEAVLEIINDEETAIQENKQETEAISEKGADGVANKASFKGFHKKLEDEDGEATDEGEFEGSVSDGETDDMIFGSSEAAKQFIEELERSGAGSHAVIDNTYDQSDRMDGQIVTDSDEEVETDGEGEGKELFDSAALAALLKAASSAGSDGGNITISSQDGSRLFSIERPAGLGTSARSLRPGTRPTHPNFLPPSNLARAGESEDNLSEEEKKKLEKVQALRVKYLRLVQRLGVSSDESIAAQVLYRLALVAGRQAGPNFSLDSAKRIATEREAEGKEDLDFSVNVLIIGKSGVGKSATINSIFGEERASINAFEPATTVVKEISGVVNGVKVKVFDTPGLKSAVMEQAFNRRVLSSISSLTKKSPPDIILYVDRLDTQTRDLNDLPLLKTITSSLGTSIWKNSIVTLTHAASAPPEGPSGSPLSYEIFVTQRSHVLQQCIGHAVGDLRMMSPSLMNPVSLVENHPSCRKNRDGQKVLPNGQTWRSQLLLLCFSMKMLSEATSLTKSQDPFDNRKLFGFRTRSPPLPYMLSSMLQSRPHPKLQTDQGIDNGDSDNELADLSDIEEEEEDEYDQLPPFKPLRKSQLAKLSREQRNAYFEEYDYRVKLLQKKQWKEELRRMREMKKKGKTPETDYGFNGEDDQDASPAPVATPLPDMALPPSFDGDSPAYRYRFLEPTSQFLARPVLDTHGWDHDCGYDGVNIEHALAILSQFPAAVSLQMTKDKKEFSLHFDSSIAAKHGDNGSSMLGFDIQNIGKQLAYIVRGETKLKTLKRNKTAAGMSVTFLGENMVTGFKAENQVAWGKQWAAVTSAGTVRCQSEAAYGANIEVQRREIDYPIGQVQSTYGVSLIRWRGDWALGFNTMAQFSAGRNSKVAVRAGLNNKMSGQVTVRTSSSEQLVLALAGLLPIVTNIYKKIWPAVGGENYSIY